VHRQPSPRRLAQWHAGRFPSQWEAAHPRLDDERAHLGPGRASHLQRALRKKWRADPVAQPIRTGREDALDPTSPDGLACLLKTFAHPVRLRILNLLALAGGTNTVDQLCKSSGRERRLISQYLQTLARAKLVQSQRQGRSLVYKLTNSGRRLVTAARALVGTSEPGAAELIHDQSPRRVGNQHRPSGRADTLANFMNILKAFADPVRSRLLNLLAGRREICVCRLHEALNLPPSTVSWHLTTLRQAGLIVGRRHGTWVLLPARAFRTRLQPALGPVSGPRPSW